MEQMYKRTDTFLTHTWRPDLYNRDNHQRVAQVNEQLNKRGFVTWFDSKRMEGRIRDKMAEGVDFTSCVLVFVTEAYMKKLDSGDKNDNCLYEYERALMKKEKSVLCVVMEAKFDNPAAWFGRLKSDLGGNLFVSMSGDLNNQLYLKQKIDELVEQLKLKDVTPSQIRKICPSCKIHDESNTPIPLHGNGVYCTICKRALVQAPEPRYYYGKCNLHRHGRYCSECKQDLIDPRIKITEIEDQYLKEVKLMTRLDISQFPPLAEKCQHEIEMVQNELQKLEEKRSRALSAGTKLVMDQKDYVRNTEAVGEAVASLKHTSSNLTQSALKCYELENIYIDEIQRLQEMMTHLAEKRNEISQRTNDLSRSFNDCVGTSDLVSNLMIELKSYGALEETDDLPNHSHDKQKCICELCTFENQLTAQMELDGGRDFLQALITDDNIHSVKMAIKFRNEILHLTNDNRLNLLMSLILQNGTVDMMVALVEIGLQLETDELIKHINLGYGQTFIQRLVFENRIDDLKQVLSLYKEILLLKNNEGLNLLMSLSFKHRTVDALAALEEMGLQLDAAELMKQVRQGSGETFMRELIVDNKANEMLKLISLYKEILLLTDEDGLNLLTALILQEGTFEMLGKLMEAGLQMDNIELMLQMNSASGKGFIEKMIVGDKTEDIKQMTTIWKDIVHLNNDKESNLLIYLTLKHGTASMLATLLDLGLDTNELMKQFQLEYGQTFLKNLVVGNKIDDLVKLLSVCKDVLLLKNEVGINPLISFTLENGKVDMLIMFVERFFQGEANELMKKQVYSGYVVKFLRKLITDDEIDSVKRLVLTWKEDLKTMCENGFNVLLYYTVQQGTLGMFNMLVDAGLKIDVTPNAHNETYLHHTNNVEIAQMLCQKHGDRVVSIKDAIGCTSFMKAYIKNNIPLLKMMKPYVKSPGEEIKSCESYKQIFQQYKEKGVNYITRLIVENDISTMRTLLIAAPEIIDLPDDNEYMPIMNATRMGTLDMMKLLLEFGSDILQRVKDGFSALHLAVYDNDTHGELIINYLCSHFPELMTAENSVRENAFHLACEHNIENHARILLQHKPSPTTLLKKNKFGQTPIDLANKSVAQMFNNYLKEHNSS